MTLPPNCDNCGNPMVEQDTWTDVHHYVCLQCHTEKTPMRRRDVCAICGKPIVFDIPRTMDHKCKPAQTDMTCRLVKLIFGRWVIQHPDDVLLAWSGARWVSMDRSGFPVGGVQICNFETFQQAFDYAVEQHFEVLL